MEMRSRRISKRGFASLVGTIMLVLLSEPIADYSPVMGRRVFARAARNGGYCTLYHKARMLALVQPTQAGCKAGKGPVEESCTVRTSRTAVPESPC
ncbi:hypothetical protein AVEN_207654-1 [Araneus ventricosus]|uniref:Uncharacterized protein n=1 Tax=Araneus ventricosus TaxID=182803 RepID=A0A4Y2A134_ARAVE|nr:hypothetical protein AVEN_207654-1 [Araneus ventricosus]